MCLAELLQLTIFVFIEYIYLSVFSLPIQNVSASWQSCYLLSSLDYDIPMQCFTITPINSLQSYVSLFRRRVTYQYPVNFHDESSLICFTNFSQILTTYLSLISKLKPLR